MCDLNHLWPCFMVFDEKSAVNFIEKPIYTMSSFFPATFRMISLFLSFDSLILMYLGLHFFEFILLGVCWSSWICRLLFFINLGKNLVIFSNIPFLSFYLLSCLDSHYAYIHLLDGVPESLRHCSFFFILLFFCFRYWIKSISVFSRI